MSEGKRFELTAEQKAVVECGDKRFLVRASAGAGKTSVLVELYLRRVMAEGYQADEILTITFTRKAAAEMKRRIVARLIEAGLPDQAQVAETGPIQTIHGFCERMLRENALAAGLDPEFDVLEGSKKSALFEECLKRTLAEASDNCPEAAQLINRLIGKFGYQDRQPHDKLSKAIRMTVEQLRGCGASLDEVRHRYRSAESVQDVWREHFLSQYSLEVQAELKTKEEADWPKALKDLKLKLPTNVGGAVRSHDKILDAAADTCGLVQLACSTWELLEYGMSDLRALDFTKLEAAAVKLLENNPNVRERLQSQYKTVLIDEAQDLNPMQYRLLTALDLDRSMMVGDAQQSIYGFRQADVRLFQRAIETLPTLQLSRNHRSDAGILAFVDDVFLRYWTDSYVPMGERPDASDFDLFSEPDWTGVEFWVQADKDTRQIADWIKELNNEGVRYSDIAVLTRHNYYAIEIQTILEALGVPSRVVGGSERFYTRLVVRDIANALRALSDPYDDYSMLAVLRSPFVGASLDAIALLSMQRPVIETLRTGALTLGDDSAKVAKFLEWFEHLCGYADRLPAWETIGEMFVASRYIEKLARRQGCHQLIANARKVLALATGEPELGPADFAERIREIQDMGHREGDAPAVDENVEAVTLMTIHKAKGLEFPVVVVPEVHYTPKRRPDDVVVDPWLQMVATKFGSVKTFYAAWLIERKYERDVEEEMRLLYVALTRAEKRLCLAASSKPSQSANLGQRIFRDFGLSGGALHGSTIRRDETEPEPEPPTE